MVFKNIVTAFLTTVMISLPAWGHASEALGALMQELSEAENETAAQRVENQIITEWSKSGSAAMDLLLKRGRDALEIEEYVAAREHFRALTDHAPGFAEGWHGLALAYYEDEMFGPAMDALGKVLALNPEHFGALRGVGAINELVGNSVLAYEAFERVLDLRPHDADVQKAMQRLEREVKGVTL